MQYDAKTPEDYISQIPKERLAAFTQLRKTIQEHLPQGFKEEMSYGMIGYVVPHAFYPAGYHVDPKIPLPFLSIASQKKFIALYHMGVYADENLYKWFIAEYPKHCKTKLDMGKSCIRFKKLDDIPYDLIGDLLSRMTMEKWIKLYERNLKKQ